MQSQILELIIILVQGLKATMINLPPPTANQNYLAQMMMTKNLTQ